MKVFKKSVLLVLFLLMSFGLSFAVPATGTTATLQLNGTVLSKLSVVLSTNVINSTLNGDGTAGVFDANPVLRNYRFFV